MEDECPLRIYSTNKLQFMPLCVGIPKELKPEERRVSLTPKGTQTLSKKGIVVYVEKNAGLLSGFTNVEYEKAGAIIVDDPSVLWHKAQLIKKVKEPVSQEFPFFSSEHVIFAFLHLASPSAKPLIDALVKAKASAIGYETVVKDHDTPLLRPMSEVAGTLAAYYGAIFQHKILFDVSKITGFEQAKKLMLECASKYPSVPNIKYKGSVVVLGGGHVGKSAAEMAALMGGEVWVSDIDETKRQQLSDSFLARNINIHLLDPKSDDYLNRLKTASVLIGAVHSPGKRSPIVIDENLLRAISQSPKIILDVAIDQGGCIADSRPFDYERLVYSDRFGNLRFSVTNIPSFCGRGASLAMEQASLEYTDALTRGLQEAVNLYPELRSGINLLKGEIVHAAVREAHGL